MASRGHLAFKVGFTHCTLSQIPAEAGRFVVEANVVGTGLNMSPTLSQTGLAVWDFDTVNNVWRPTNFWPYDGYWDYAVRQGTACPVSDTKVVLYGGADTQAGDAKTYRAIIDFEAKPRFKITPVSPFEYFDDERYNYVSYYSNPATYDGYMVLGTWRDRFINVYTTENGYIDKIGPTGSIVKMSGALRTGLSASDTYQGRPGDGIAALGGATPNGYFVATAGGPDWATTSNFALVNCKGTPYKVTGVSWPGFQTSTHFVAAMSANSVVVSDFADSSYTGRLNLLYTDSATDPTTLTRGAYVTMPDPPDGCGYSADDVDHISIATVGANNYWCKSGALLIAAYWKMTDENYVLGLLIARSNGNSNLTIEHANHDIHGNAAANYLYGEYSSFTLVGAPGGKATVLAVNNNGILTQQTFQL
jgi:hypothetical protein